MSDRPPICPLYGREVAPGVVVQTPLEGTYPTAYTQTVFEDVVTPPDQSAQCRAGDLANRAGAKGGLTIGNVQCRRCGLWMKTVVSPDQSLNREVTSH